MVPVIKCIRWEEIAAGISVSPTCVCVSPDTFSDCCPLMCSRLSAVHSARVSEPSAKAENRSVGRVGMSYCKNVLI